MHKLFNFSTYAHLVVLSMLICVSVRGRHAFTGADRFGKLYFRVIGLCCLQNH